MRWFTNIFIIVLLECSIVDTCLVIKGVIAIVTNSMYDVSPMYLTQNKEQVMVYSYCSTSGFILQASFIVTCSSWYTKRCQTLIEKELGSAIMHDHPKRTRDFLVFLSFFIMVLPSNLELERAIYWFNIQHRKNYGADTVSSYALSSCHLDWTFVLA